MEEPKKKFVEQWSAISQGDLGLKAAYWTDDKKGVTFRPIVGWTTFTYREVGAPPDVGPSNSFAAVVISDFWFPVSASFVPNYAGVVPKDATAEQVLTKLQEFEKAGAPQEPIGINVREVGKA
jgi:hypothetical protein